jgi:hypothetical protein
MFFFPTALPGIYLARNVHVREKKIKPHHQQYTVFGVYLNGPLEKNREGQKGRNEDKICQKIHKIHKIVHLSTVALKMAQTKPETR